MFNICYNKPIILLWNGKLVYIVVNIMFFFKKTTVSSRPHNSRLTHINTLSNLTKVVGKIYKTVGNYLPLSFNYRRPKNRWENTN